MHSHCKCLNFPSIFCIIFVYSAFPLHSSNSSCTICILYAKSVFLLHKLHSPCIFRIPFAYSAIPLHIPHSLCLFCIPIRILLFLGRLQAGVRSVRPWRGRLDQQPRARGRDEGHGARAHRERDHGHAQRDRHRRWGVLRGRVGAMFVMFKDFCCKIVQNDPFACIFYIRKLTFLIHNVV